MSDAYDETTLNPAAQTAETRPIAEVESAFPPAIDHRALLVKYMALIRAHEGTDFLPSVAQTRARPVDEIDPERPTTAAELAFTDSEWAELRRLSEEASRG